MAKKGRSSDDRFRRASARRPTSIAEALIPQLSPLAWDHINLTGDYVWSAPVALDADGYMPLKLPAA